MDYNNINTEMWKILLGVLKDSLSGFCIVLLPVCFGLLVLTSPIWGPFWIINWIDKDVKSYKESKTPRCVGNPYFGMRIINE